MDIKSEVELITVRRSFSKKNTSRAFSLTEYALMINGGSISVIFEDPSLSKIMRFIFENSASVVVFRSSPNEKAEVIKFVQQDKSIFTLAIGDGGNDVNMIQTAAIGIGIMGKEGNQAA
jgi:magnesium-transporting ATPase (P-type)